MRIFAGDTVPGLALVAPALPRPWVLPDGIGRRHRNRLVRLLYAALHATQPGLRLGELRWGERDLVARGRMSLPAEILIRWRIDPLPGLERREVMRECERLGPSLAVFDFGPGRGEQILAWLGRFKMETLHRLMDALLDHAPVEPIDQVVDILNDFAERLQSPVDLIDAAETMVEQIALGQAVSGARAEACARVLVGRFEDGDDEPDGTDVLRALAVLADAKEPTADVRALLEAVGLLEPDGARLLPLAELVREDEVHRRAQRMIATRFSLREHAPGMDIIDAEFHEDAAGAATPAQVTIVSGHARKDLAQPVPARSEPREEFLSVPVDPRFGILWRAGAHLREERNDEAARLVIEALREQDVATWPPMYARDAGEILSIAASHAEETGRPLLASTWAEASAEAFKRAGDSEDAADMYVLAAQAAREAGDPARTIALLEPWKPEMDRLAPELQARMYQIQGDGYAALERFPEAEAAYEQALVLAERGGDPLQQLSVHLALGEIQLERGRPKAARQSYRSALALSRKLGDRELEARSRLGLGKAYLDLHDYERSERTLRAALKLWPADDLSGKGEGYESLAEVLAHRGAWSAALRYFRRALTLFQETRDWPGQSRVLQELGSICLELHEVGSARAAFEVLLTGSRRHGDMNVEILALASMSEVLCWLGDVDAARQQAHLAMERAQQVSEFAAEVAARLALGRIHIWTGDLDSAESVYAQALAHAPEQQDARDSVLVLRLARLAVAIARGDQPRDLAEACRQLAEAQASAHAKPLVAILAAALPLPEEIAAARAIWAHAAEELHRVGAYSRAALTRIMVEVADGEGLDQVADKLAQRLGAIHPLPERVRAAASPTEAIRAIIAFL